MASFPSTSERNAAAALLHLSGSESNTPDPLISAPHNLRHRANAILKLLSAGGSYLEAEIRQELGDTPDTSKALRWFDFDFGTLHATPHSCKPCTYHSQVEATHILWLLGREEVKRSGKGGREDPFIYTKA